MKANYGRQDLGYFLKFIVLRIGKFSLLFSSILIFVNIYYLMKLVTDVGNILS
jgi:hypothetical protein